MANQEANQVVNQVANQEANQMVNHEANQMANQVANQVAKQVANQLSIGPTNYLCHAVSKALPSNTGLHNDNNTIICIFNTQKLASLNPLNKLLPS